MFYRKVGEQVERGEKPYDLNASRQRAAERDRKPVRTTVEQLTPRAELADRNKGAASLDVATEIEDRGQAGAGGAARQGGGAPNKSKKRKKGR